MDPAVALVQAYLRINGYFTVSEYPVLESLGAGRYQMATDMDILAFRFAGAGRYIPGDGEHRSEGGRFHVDPELGAPADAADMVIGEVKEGRAELNPATRDPEVLRVALARFGCCPLERTAEAVDALLRRGHATLPNGHRVRMVAFGTEKGGPRRTIDRRVTLGHVTEYLRSYLHEHWAVLRHAQFKDPALGFLVTLVKAEG